MSDKSNGLLTDFNLKMMAGIRQLQATLAVRRKRDHEDEKVANDLSKENPGPKQKLCLATTGIQDSKDQSSQKTGKLNRKTQLKELKIQIVRTAIELEKQRIDIQENLKELIKFDKEAKERRNLMNSALKELRDKIETIEKDFQKWINMCIPENTKLKVCDPECKLEQLSQENEMVKSGKATRDEELERVEK